MIVIVVIVMDDGDICALLDWDLGRPLTYCAAGANLQGAHDFTIHGTCSVVWR
jgi:hypothetical protein